MYFDLICPLFPTLTFLSTHPTHFPPKYMSVFLKPTAMDIRPSRGIGTLSGAPNDFPSPKCHQIPMDLKLQAGLCEPFLQLQHELYL